MGDPNRSQQDADNALLSAAMRSDVPELTALASPATIDLIDTIGLEAAGELCDRLGVLSINLPAQIVDDVLGEEVARAFNDRFGPGRMYVPRSLADRKMRRLRIVALAKQNRLTRQEIARKVGVTEKTVYNALRDARRRGEIAPAPRSPLAER